MSNHLILMAVILLCVGTSWRLITLVVPSLDYLHYAYIPPYANADIFLVGVLGAYYQKEGGRAIVPKKLAILMLSVSFAFSFLACYEYKTVANRYLHGIYAYFMPAFISVATICIILACSADKNCTLNGVRHRIVMALSNVSFEFYLFHSLVLSKVYPMLLSESSLIRHIELLIITFVVSYILSLGYHYVTTKVLEYIFSKVEG